MTWKATWWGWNADGTSTMYATTCHGDTYDEAMADFRNKVDGRSIRSFAWLEKKCPRPVLNYRVMPSDGVPHFVKGG